MSTRTGGVVAFLLAAGITLAPAAARAEGPGSSERPIRIGVAASLFRGLPPQVLAGLMEPFAALVKRQTGMDGELVPVLTADELARMLDDRRVDFAVFPGVDYAWAEPQYARLRPLMLAVNQSRRPRACLVVRRDAGVECLSDLKGKTVALAQSNHDYGPLFLARECGRCARLEPAAFFRRVTTPPDAEDALDDVVDGRVQAAVVERVGLDCFRRRKPARFARLEVLAESEPFPATVVAYRAGALDRGVVRRFRDGMLAAARPALGRQMLTLMHLTGFVPLPAGYEETLAYTSQTYKQPEQGPRQLLSTLLQLGRR